ncbi:MAG: hypothetical protein KJZ96_05970 [Rhodocyclaceae bacterium]|nr:PAN domain-containing protein [Rhodocyclaceae bacterium]MCL4757874.1 hypothetical protein [Rhodocyclaceae bacterium]
MTTSMGMQAIQHIMLTTALAIAALLPTPARACGFNCDIPGGDMAAHYIQDANACANACRSTRGCLGWTWVRPGIQGPQAVCYLKSHLNRAQGSNCCISGTAPHVRYNPMTYGFEVGNKVDLPPMAPPPAPAARPPQRFSQCFCVDSRGQRYPFLDDLYGQPSCRDNSHRFMCQ